MHQESHLTEKLDTVSILESNLAKGKLLVDMVGVLGVLGVGVWGGKGW